MSRRASTLAIALLLAMAAGAPAARAELPAPVAGGTSAANIDLSGGQKRALVRWVARSTGTLTALHLRIEGGGSDCRQGVRAGYGAGNGGSWHVTTHPVRADGRPDESTTLATQDFRPCEAPTSVADVRQGVVRLAMGLDVAKGAEYATVIRNDDPAPAQNYTSANFLYTSTGILGANGRNERSPLAPDSYYGLDPRELVGYSKDGGQSWSLPGGPYGLPGGRNFLPTYLQEYASGEITGQPYYYTSPGQSGDRTMVFQNIRHDWTIRELGAYTPNEGSGTLSLTVDGRRVASVPVSGSGMLRAAISPVTVSAGQVVRVTASGLTILNVVADTAWGRLMGLYLASKPWYVEAEPVWNHAAPVYALPAYGAPDPMPPAETPPPADPPPPAQTPPAEEPPPTVTAPPADPPAPDPPAASPPVPDPPAVTQPDPEPPAVTPPAPIPPAAIPPIPDPPAGPTAPVDPPPVTPPVADPPLVTPPPVIPPAIKPPVAKPPVVRPPVVRPPVVKPPKPSPRPGCRKRSRLRDAARRPRARCVRGPHSASARDRNHARTRFTLYSQR